MNVVQLLPQKPLRIYDLIPETILPNFILAPAGRRPRLLKICQPFITPLNAGLPN